MTASLTASWEDQGGPVLLSCSEHGQIGAVPPLTGGPDAAAEWDAAIDAHVTAEHPDVDRYASQIGTR